MQETMGKEICPVSNDYDWVYGVKYDDRVPPVQLSNAVDYCAVTLVEGGP